MTDPHIMVTTAVTTVSITSVNTCSANSTNAASTTSATSTTSTMTISAWAHPQEVAYNKDISSQITANSATKPQISGRNRFPASLLPLGCVLASCLGLVAAPLRARGWAPLLAGGVLVSPVSVVLEVDLGAVHVMVLVGKLHNECTLTICH